MLPPATPTFVPLPRGPNGHLLCTVPFYASGLLTEEVGAQLASLRVCGGGSVADVPWFFS